LPQQVVENGTYRAPASRHELALPVDYTASSDESPAVEAYHEYLGGVLAAMREARS